MRVFVLLFNAGADNEGIHTLKMGEDNVVLMFEQEDDANRYALMLEAQDFGSPSVESFDAEEIEEFCQGSGYACRFVPQGALEMPPEANVDSPDWQPEQSDPVKSDPAQSDPVKDASALSDTELDRIRRQLERLL